MISFRFFSLVVTDTRNASSLIYFTGCRFISRCFNGQNYFKCQLPGLVKKSPISKRAVHSSYFLFKEATTGSKPNSDNIQLLGINGEPRGVMRMQKAELLAKEEQLKLLQVEDHGNSSPVYRLVTTKEFNQEQKKLKALKQMEKQKSAKSLKLSSNISSHDLQIKIKHIMDWLEKGHEVKVLIKTGNSKEGENQVFDQVITACKELATIQNSKKTEAELVFQLLPKIKSETTSGNPLADQKQKPLKLDELKKMKLADKASKTDNLSR